MSRRLRMLSARETVRVFERAGFRVLPSRGKGSHVVMARDDAPGLLVIPSHGDVRRGRLRSLIKNSGLTVERFLQLLDEM